jgi:cytochrome c oxidase subunit 4
MSTTAAAEHDTHDAGHGAPAHAHQGPSDLTMVKVAVVLAILTAIEVVFAELGLGAISTWVLIILMVVKFIIVVLYFMHLKFDSKIFSYLFWAGALLAIAVYVAAMACFQMFAS